MFGDYSEAGIAKLRAALPAALEAITVAKADGLELLAPPDDGVGALGSARVGYSLGTKEILSYPWVEIAEINATLSELSIGQVTGSTTPLVVVRALYRHADVDVLDRCLKRYAWAMLQCLCAPGAWTQSVVVRTVRATWATNPGTESVEQLVGAVVLEFELDDAIDFA